MISIQCNEDKTHVEMHGSSEVVGAEAIIMVRALFHVLEKNDDEDGVLCGLLAAACEAMSAYYAKKNPLPYADAKADFGDFGFSKLREKEGDGEC